MIPDPDPRPDDVAGPDPTETNNGPKPDDPPQDVSQDGTVEYEDGD
jgi:hypothetical protein